MNEDTQIILALEALESGQIRSIREAARQFSVPRSTLAHRRNGRPARRTAHTSQQACTEEEEQALIKWIQHWSSQGFPIRHDMLRAMAEHLILGRNGTSRRNTVSTHVVGHNWASRFVKRHQDLQSIITMSIGRPRSTACTAENLNKWFDTFRDNMKRYKPDTADIYNIGETTLSIGSAAEMYAVIDKHQGSIDNAAKAAKGELLITIECVSADGSTILPPFVIFEGKHLQSTWISDGIPDNWMAATSPRGWTSNELGLRWLEQHFEPNTRPAGRGRSRYRFLILDGHGSHITPDFQDSCAKHKIVLLSLPAHTSHMLQPLDVSILTPVKHLFKQTIDSRLQMGKVPIPRTEFLNVYCETRLQAMTAKNITSGFRKAGLIPFNPAIVLRQLPAAPPLPPDSVIPLHSQTPKTARQFQNAMDLRQRSNTIENSEQKIIVSKISKGTAAALADREIMQKEHQNMLDNCESTQETTFKRRKRVSGSRAMTVGEVRGTLHSSKSGRITKRSIRSKKSIST
jgi:hypothetical protein